MPRLLLLEVRPRTAPTAAPIAHLLTEREEQYEFDEQGKVSKASIRIWYERIDPKRPFAYGPRPNLCFEGSYHAWREPNGCVSLTSLSLGHGAVYLDLEGLKGHRIGTYLMNEIVSWAKQWPKAEVHPVQLLAQQAIDSDNKLRRNRFYTQFGLSFDFEDDEDRAGMSAPITVEQLRASEAWRLNIQAQPLDRALRDALAAIDNARIRLGTLTAEYNQFRSANAHRRILWRRVLTLAAVAFMLLVFATAAILRRIDIGQLDHTQPTQNRHASLSTFLPSA